MTDYSQWLASARSELDALDVEGVFERVGVVEHCGDDIATISGLAGIRLSGLVQIGDRGLALALSLPKMSLIACCCPPALRSSQA